MQQAQKSLTGKSNAVEHVINLMLFRNMIFKVAQKHTYMLLSNFARSLSIHGLGYTLGHTHNDKWS